MSEYNKVIKNEDGITASELNSLLDYIVKDSKIYVYIDSGKDFPTARKIETISSEFGCLYITVKDNDK